MKKKRFCLVMLVGILALGLTFIGCDNGSSSEIDGPKSLKIINISGYSGSGGVFIYQQLVPPGETPTNAAIAYGDAFGSSVTLDLLVPINNTYEGGPKWTGSGDYYVLIVPCDDHYIYMEESLIFTDGGNSPVKVTFDKALVTLDFGKFMSAF